MRTHQNSRKSCSDRFAWHSYANIGWLYFLAVRHQFLFVLDKFMPMLFPLRCKDALPIMLIGVFISTSYATEQPPNQLSLSNFSQPALQSEIKVAKANTFTHIASGESNAKPALPASFSAALAKAKIPQDAVSVFVQAVDDRAPPRLAFRDKVLSNPASVMKLVTTFAALDRLGPAYTWKTYVFSDGKLHNGTLGGNLYIRGTGDPKLTMERLWAMLRQIQQRNAKIILGDIVLDHSAYSLPAHDANAFDGEALRPYNASPDALLINYKSVILRFVPDKNEQRAHILVAPPIEKLDIPASVPLSSVASNGKALRTCPADWRDQLQIDVTQSDKWIFSGSYPAVCGELNWPIAYPYPDIYANKTIEGMWRELGGSLTGSVRKGITPAGLTLLETEDSLPLADIVRDVNKYSNNIMADHVFLALSDPDALEQQSASYEQARLYLQQWWTRSIGNPAEAIIIDNGSGLSRQGRLTTNALGNMLRHAWSSSVMPEFIASLPSAGVDGTLRRSKVNASAHLKTGSLRDVNAIAGYVKGRSGKRYVLAAIVNHPNAEAAQGAPFNKLIEWVADE